MRYWDRRVRVAIGPEEDMGLELKEDFAIEFDIKKTSSSDTNDSDVRIYGLSEDTRNLFTGQGNICRIRAGYASDGEDLPVLLLSEVLEAKVVHEPPEIITEFRCADGAIALSKARLGLSYGPGTEVASVYRDVSRRLGLDLRETGVELTGTYKNGISISGSASRALDVISSRAGVTWSIQDRALQVLRPNTAAVGSGFLLSPETGLLGSPTPIAKEDSRDKGDLYGKGYTIKTLLNGRILPGSRVMISSRELDDETFWVHEVHHKGATFSGEYTSTLKVFEEATG